jgi:hypothetical protein
MKKFGLAAKLGPRWVLVEVVYGLQSPRAVAAALGTTSEAYCVRSWLPPAKWVGREAGANHLSDLRTSDYS